MKRCKPRRNRPVNPLDVLATGLDARDHVVVGVREVREVRVTQRVSIKRTFNAPRIEMGEYSPVSTLAAEQDKRRKGWNGEGLYLPGV